MKACPADRKVARAPTEHRRARVMLPRAPDSYVSSTGYELGAVLVLRIAPSISYTAAPCGA